MGLYHLAWEVDTLDELERVAQSLAQANALGGSSDHGTTKSLYGHDPDGLEFEIVWLIPADLLDDAALDRAAAYRASRHRQGKGPIWRRYRRRSRDFAHCGQPLTLAARPLRTGIIGYGLAGSVFHAPLIAATPALDLVAVVTRNETRADQARSTYDGVRVFAAAAEMLSTAELDLVVVAAPNREHAQLAHAAIDAGIAVVVDKPFAVSSHEAESVRRSRACTRRLAQRLSKPPLGRRFPYRATTSRARARSVR